MQVDTITTKPASAIQTTTASTINSFETDDSNSTSATPPTITPTTTTTTNTNHCIMIGNSLSPSSICQSSDDIDENSEHDLTNLEWLIDMKNLTNLACCGGNVIDVDNDNDMIIDENRISSKKMSQERFNKFMMQVKQ